MPDTADIRTSLIRESFQFDGDKFVILAKPRPDSHFVTSGAARAHNRKHAGKPVMLYTRSDGARGVAIYAYRGMWHFTAQEVIAVLAGCETVFSGLARAA